MQTPERSELLPLLADLSPAQFETTALSVFRYQAKANPFYAKYLKLLGRNPETIDRLSDIPFLPIQFFKKQEIQKKFDEIIDFSGVETFLDTPLKKYSSGIF